MKLSSFLTILSAAIASSRSVVVRDSSDDVQDMSIAGDFGDPLPGDNPFTFCKGDRSKDAITITQVDIVPNPPARGKDLTVSVAATVKDAIQEGAVVDVKVKFIASTVYKHRFNVCDELEKLGQSCPVFAGPIFVNQTYAIPKKGYPHGQYSFNAFARFPDGRPITCVEGRVKL